MNITSAKCTEKYWNLSELCKMYLTQSGIYYRRQLFSDDSNETGIFETLVLHKNRRLRNFGVSDVFQFN